MIIRMIGNSNIKLFAHEENISGQKNKTSHKFKHFNQICKRKKAEIVILLVYRHRI